MATHTTQCIFVRLFISSGDAATLQCCSASCEPRETPFWVVCFMRTANCVGWKNIYRYMVSGVDNLHHNNRIVITWGRGVPHYKYYLIGIPYVPIATSGARLRTKYIFPEERGPRPHIVQVQYRGCPRAVN